MPLRYKAKENITKERSMKLLKYALILILINSHSLSAQSNNAVHTNNFSGFLKTFKHLPENSISLINNQRFRMLTYSGLTTLFLLGEDSEYHENYSLKKEFGLIGIPKFMGSIGAMYDNPGTIHFTAGLLSSLYGSGLILNDDKLKKTSGLMIKSLILTGLINTSLKVIIGRARPYENKGHKEYKHFNFKFDPDYMSMPSGHTSSIFAMMTVLAKQYDSWQVKLPAYTFAISVAFQRMNNNKHWGSDLLVGGMTGYLVASNVIKSYKYKKRIFNFKPIINSWGIGLAINF